MRFSLLMTWQRVLQKNRKCKNVWIKYLIHVIAMISCISASTWKALQWAYITVKGQLLQVIDKFTYFGSTLSRVVHIDDEVNARIAKASAAFGRLRGSIRDQSEIRLDTKLKIYRSMQEAHDELLICSAANTIIRMRNLEVYQRHAKRLNHFHTSCLRKRLKIKWQVRIPDTEVLKTAGMQSVHTLLKLVQLRWADHVTRMPDERLPKKILYGELQIGKRSAWWSEEVIQGHPQSLL